MGETDENLLWTVEMEVNLFHAMKNLKPVGMLCFGFLSVSFTTRNFRSTFSIRCKKLIRVSFALSLVATFCRTQQAFLHGKHL